LTDIFFIRK